MFHNINIFQAEYLLVLLCNEGSWDWKIFTIEQFNQVIHSICITKHIPRNKSAVVRSIILTQFPKISLTIKLNLQDCNHTPFLISLLPLWLLETDCLSGLTGHSNWLTGNIQSGTSSTKGTLNKGTNCGYIMW